MTYFTGLGLDFDSNSFNITIDAGETEGRGNVSVISDDAMEGLETFNMILSLVTEDSQITLGRDRSEGQIIDSTGKRWCFL